MLLQVLSWWIHFDTLLIEILPVWQGMFDFFCWGDSVNMTLKGKQTLAENLCFPWLGNTSTSMIHDGSFQLPLFWDSKRNKTSPVFVDSCVFVEGFHHIGAVHGASLQVGASWYDEMSPSWYQPRTKRKLHRISTRLCYSKMLEFWYMDFSLLLSNSFLQFPARFFFGMVLGKVY